MKITADLDRVFVTADHHWGHANILGYCDRPFDNVEEMDAEMVRRWNEVVGSDDEVFHLGDFTIPFTIRNVIGPIAPSMIAAIAPQLFEPRQYSAPTNSVKTLAR